MEPFTTLTGIAAPLDMDNVDTDMIVPSRFLRKPRSAGYGNFLFADIRRLEGGEPDPDFVLNRPEYRDTKILVGGMNFGCGSSRVGAVYAIADSGVRCVIAASFGDIFANSCVQHGVLPVALSPEQCVALRQQLKGKARAQLTVNLVEQPVITPDGSVVRFDVPSVTRERLLKGLDDIGRVLEHEQAIAVFEQRYFDEYPWRLPKYADT
jgi:3-isopropylmalate/(R)-2-methylmalate dehydratase small subunit